MPNKELSNQNNPFKEIMDSCKGHIFELKESCAAAMDISKRWVDKLYSGQVNDMKMSDALKFIAWANANKVAGAPDFTMDDLTPKEEVETNL